LAETDPRAVVTHALVEYVSIKYSIIILRSYLIRGVREVEA
jgi:hypothetical protein